jgi:fluoride ion exporter CrcB/FEX
LIGGVLRYGLSTWMYPDCSDNPMVSYSTLMINGLGCLVIGFWRGLAESRLAFTPGNTHLFVGILGGFTALFSSLRSKRFS